MAQGIAYLDGPRLRRCLTAGLQRLIDQREYLNRINVFPVPDGDTGNNLAHAALVGQQSLAGAGSASAGNILETLAAAVLDAAQGNSGALLAQFLQGLAESTAAQQRLNTAEFAAAMNNAAATTRLALAAPREGTILTIIDASAIAAEYYADSDDFTVLLPAMVSAARLALAATTGQIEALRKAGVVDAGAAGFCAILEGCSDYLLSGSIRSTAPTPQTPAEFSLHTEHATGDIRYRFCTECMLISSALEPLIIRSTLDHLGDSMVIAGSSRRLRIHIHTDDPEEVFRLAAQFGDVHSTKADDMHGQAKSLVRKNKGVAIVTDSAADLPAELIKELDIHVVPLRVTFGSKSYLDKISLNPAQFLAELQRNPAPPGTSQPTQGDLRRMYEFLLTHFTEVLSINLSSKLSGTYQAACLAASAVSGSERIRILDSANVSVGQGLIVKRAGELAAAGITGTALWTVVQEEIGSMRTFALVTDLSNAVRSGRLKPVLKRVTDLLHLTPVLMNTRSGKVGVHGFIPGRFRLTKRFARYIARAMGAAGRWEVAIASSTPGSPEIELLQAELAAQLKGVSAIWQTDIGPALGVHIGMTGLVVAIRKLN